MITIEFDEDETLITVLDGTGELEDVSALLYEDYCHSRQWDNKRDRFNIITLTPEMYLKIMESWNLPEGAYKIHLNQK